MKGTKENPKVPWTNYGTYVDPEDGVTLRFDPKFRCRARSKQNDLRRCKKQAMMGKRVCYSHGGKSPGRPPKHMKHARVPSSLRRAYRESLNDSGLTDLRKPLAVLNAITQKAMDLVEEKDTPKFRERSLEMVREARNELTAGNPTKGLEKLARLEELLERGVSEMNAMKDLGDAVERFSKRAEAYWNVKLSRKQVMNLNDVMVLLRAFVAIVKTEAPSEVAARIVERIDHDVYRNSFGQSVLTVPEKSASKKSGSKS